MGSIAIASQADDAASESECPYTGCMAFDCSCGEECISGVLEASETLECADNPGTAKVEGGVKGSCAK